MKTRVLIGGWSYLGRRYEKDDDFEGKPSLIKRLAEDGYVEAPPEPEVEEVETAEAPPPPENAAKRTKKPARKTRKRKS